MKAKGLYFVLGSMICLFYLASLGCTPEYPNCKTDEHCKSKGEFCINGKCQQCRDVKDCKEGQSCESNTCTDIPGYCSANKPCPEGQICKANRCAPECETNADCAGKGKNFICQGGRCNQVACITNADCPAGKVCEANYCVDKTCALDKVYFDFDQSNLTVDATTTLQRNAECLKRMGKSIAIEGHCDERGTVEYNLGLGQRRADSTKTYLGTLGVTSGMRTVSKGKEQPADPGHTESSWSKNRRAEFMVE